MSSKLLKSLSALAAVVILVLGIALFIQPETVFASSTDSQGGPGGRGFRQEQAVPVQTPLSEAEAAALTDAILEEYGALNLYQSVIDQFGAVTPFSRIVKSEQQHVNALVRLATKYNVAVPANPGLSPEPVFSTLSDACLAGVDAEIADAALYDQLETSVTHTDILQVFSNLQSASLNSHLPAFQVCQ